HMSSLNRAPEAELTIDIAGMGENPAIRSGPQRLIVYTCAAAIISTASAQVARTRPPLPRPDLYRWDFWGSCTISAHASTGSPRRLRASRNMDSSVPRTYG